jgi:hypothetical protein
MHKELGSSKRRRSSQDRWALGVASLILLPVSVALFHEARASERLTNENDAVGISGEYRYTSGRGPHRTTTTYEVTAITWQTGWNMFITNSAQPEEWGVMESDGTNIFTLETDALNQFYPFGYVFKGQFYRPNNPTDAVIMFFPWMVLHLTPAMIKDYSTNVGRDLPAPWGSHHSLLSFGFRWETSYFENSEALKRVRVIRDSSLDLKSVEDELHRKDIDYPYSFSDREELLESLQRRREIPDGFVGELYECEEIVKTNDWIVCSNA